MMLVSSPASAEYSPSTSVLAANNVSHFFTQSKGLFTKKTLFAAVSDVSFSLYPGRTLGVIGESGCGKSTLARMLTGLLHPSKGNIFVHGQNMYEQKSHAHYNDFRKTTCRSIQMVFQDPNASLNPRMRIGESVAEPLRCLYPEIASHTRTKHVATILEKVGINPELMQRYPYAFSGGQRQRIAIARALIANPDIVVCDEPTSSLDSSVQAQVLNLLDTMQKELTVSYVFISHDLTVVRHMSDEVLVMYGGYVVEQGSVKKVFSTPAHPYTQLLLDSVPTFDNIKGFVPLAPMPTTQNNGCPFYTRCPKHQPECLQSLPPLKALSVQPPETPCFLPWSSRCIFS